MWAIRFAAFRGDVKWGAQLLSDWVDDRVMYEVFTDTKPGAWMTDRG